MKCNLFVVLLRIKKSEVMLRTIFVLLMSLLAFTSFTCLMNDDPDTLILNYVPPVGGMGGGTRSQAPPIYVEQDGHTLSFSTSYAGCMIKLMDDDNFVILTDNVNDNGVVGIPTDVSGVFTLLLYVDTHTAYSGEIIL